MTAPLQRFAVLGAGSWGTALAVQLARRGHTVALWARDSQAIAAHEAARCNTRYLADTPWPDTLTGESDLARAVAGADDVLACRKLSHVPERLVLADLSISVDLRDDRVIICGSVAPKRNHFSDNNSMIAFQANHIVALDFPAAQHSSICSL